MSALQVIGDLLRGFLVYPLVLASGLLWGWLLLPPVQDSARMTLAVAGGGALVFLVVVLVIGIGSRMAP